MADLVQRFNDPFRHVDDDLPGLPEFNPLDSPQARRWKQCLYFERQQASETDRANP